MKFVSPNQPSHQNKTTTFNLETYQVIQVTGNNSLMLHKDWKPIPASHSPNHFLKGWMLLLVPICVAITYFYMWVPDRYVSTAKFLIKQGNPSIASSIGAIPLLSLGADMSKQDALMLKDYIQSGIVFNQLDRKFHLKEQFQANNLDTRLHLSPNATQEEYLNYYNQLITFEHNGTSNIITLKAQSFDPVISQKMVKEIIRLSEHFLNNVSAKIADNQLGFAKVEVNNSKTHLASIKSQLQIFQDENKTISPVDQTAAISKMIHQLEAELLQEEVNLNKYRAYLSEDAPKVQATQNTIMTLNAKIEEQTALLAGPSEHGVKLNTINNQFEQLKFEEEFWQQSYLTALKAMEISRMESIRQLKFILMVAEPSLAQVSEFPNRPYNILTLLLILFLIYGIGKLSITTIRDHQDT